MFMILSGNLLIRKCGAGLDETGWIQAFPMEEGSFAALVVWERWNVRTEGWIKIVAENRELVITHRKVSEVVWKAGSSDCELAIEIGGSGTGRTFWWVEGIQPSDQWEYEAPAYRMPWTQNCGWLTATNWMPEIPVPQVMEERVDYFFEPDALVAECEP